MFVRLLVLCTMVCCMSSCFDIYETITVNESGGGVFEQKIDMGRMMAMMALMGMDKSAEGKEKAKMDTLISYRDVADTMKGISPEERKVMSVATVRLHLNEEAGEMNIIITYPFANDKEFALIQALMAKPETERAVASLAGGMFGKSGQQLGQAAGDKQPELPVNGFNYTLTKNKLIKEVKPFPATEPASGDTGGMPPEFKEMMKFNYYTTVNLPRAIKKWDGNNGTLSVDKRQLKFNKTIDMDSRPLATDFNFSIEF